MGQTELKIVKSEMPKKSPCINQHGIKLDPVIQLDHTNTQHSMYQSRKRIEKEIIGSRSKSLVNRVIVFRMKGETIPVETQALRGTNKTLFLSAALGKRKEDILKKLGSFR